MNTTLLWLAVVIIIITAVAHSYFGEVRLIKPLLELKQGVMARELSRDVLRLAWHGTSLLFFAVAYTLAFQALHPDLAQRQVILVLGAALTFFGLVDAVVSKGRHIGWPLITLAGLSAIASSY